MVSRSTAGTSGLVRVSVTSGTRRVDLVLPSAVPVAELVPELARGVGLLDAATVHGGYRLVTRDGRHLDHDAGLAPQGVEDGEVLAVTAGFLDEPPRVYDDVVEAMADVVEQELRPWDPAEGRRTALWAAALLLGLGAWSVLLQGESLLGGVAAALVAGLLLTGAVVLGRALHEPQAAITVLGLAAVYAGVAGVVLAPGVMPAWRLAPGPEALGIPLVWAGGAVLAVGLIGLVTLQEGRALVIPPAVVGAVGAGTGAIVVLADVRPAVVLCAVLTVVVLLGNVFPRLALGWTSTTVGQLHSSYDIARDLEQVDPVRVAGDARTAHQILLAVLVTIGLLLVLVAPSAVQLGVPGTALVVACCTAVMLRTRQHRTHAEVSAGLVSGIAGLVSAMASVILLHPAWRAGSAVVLAVVGAVLLLLTLAPPSRSVRRGRWADLVETATLLSLLPLLVLAVGLLEAIRS